MLPQSMLPQSMLPQSMLPRSMLTEEQLTQVVSSSTRRSMLRADGECLYWLEQRPEAQGRTVLCKQHQNLVSDVSPSQLNIHSRVHEYGGGEYAVAGGCIVCVADPDQQIWIKLGENASWSLLPCGANRNNRFADFCWHPLRDKFYAVNEVHEPTGVTNQLCLVSLNGENSVIASGADFYSSPCINLKGDTLVWVEWDNPNMPWDATRFMCASLNSQGLIERVECLNAHRTEAIQQPSFDSAGSLYALSDREGFWNLYRVETDDWIHVVDLALECAVAPWSLGQKSYVLDQEKCYFLATNIEQSWLCAFDILQQSLIKHSIEAYPTSLAMYEQSLFFVSSPKDVASSIAYISCEEFNESVQKKRRVVKAEQSIVLPKLKYSIGDVPFWHHCNTGMESSPLILFCHSGPTGVATPSLNAVYQCWLQLGFQIADVNYRGSEGFGRKWRQSLYGHWGDWDVDDCIDVANTLLTENPELKGKLFFRGNSAGGFTALRALQRSQCFAAAALRYPVVDISDLLNASHKFEAKYLLRLIEGDEGLDQSLERLSILKSAEKITAPILIHHGVEDTVVPVSQSKVLIDELRKRDQSSELVQISDEGHGFRSAETLKSVFAAEWRFFSKQLAKPV